VDRRSFLKMTSGIVAVSAVSPVWANQSLKREFERSLDLYNLHTGEQTRSTYWVEGEYLDEGLESLSLLLRDHRSDTAIDMDPSLLDLLHDLKSVVGYQAPLHVISGYRRNLTTPVTNSPDIQMNKITAPVIANPTGLQ